ncbi:MAG: type II/IV secretion system protein, partial [Phycisphaerae bacterium]|nr:type II/IV secretion system protein [Phycisphaerae bacterium]
MLQVDSTIEYIRKEGILSVEQLQKVIDEYEQSGQNIVNILKANGLIDDEQLAVATAINSGIEYLDLNPDMIDPMTAHLIGQDMANQYCMIPVKKEAGKLYMAMAEPLNIIARDQVEMRTGFEVVALAANPDAVRGAISNHFNVRSLTRQTIASMRLKEDIGGSKERKNESEIKKLNVSEDPITKLVSSIINGAIEADASDIHIEPSESEMRVRYRVDGLLREAIEIPSSVQHEVISHIKILGDMDISEHRVPQDGHITTMYNNNVYDLRISSLPSVVGEKIVIRILDKSNNKWALDDIVTNPDDNHKFRSLAKNPYGMILLTGPTGSGKTTTLYSLLQLLNTPQRNIVTVEDPVEYRLEGITQVQVKPVAGMSFSSALRSILRQDPDVILIGEIRDFETAEIAVSAALTGHLVLSTLHTNDAAGAISRLINIGIPPFLVSSALLGTAAQRLIRTNCPSCKQEYRLS